MCEHTEHVLLKSHVMVCVNCGLLLKTVFIPSEMKLYSDYTKENIKYPYTRFKRFQNMVRSIVYGFENSNDKHMLKELSTHKIDSVQDILHVMLNSTLVDKRYCSLRYFIKCFLPGYDVGHTIHRFQEKETVLMKTFKDVEFQLTRRGRIFINYIVMLDALLYFFNLDEYRIFIKPLKCQRRLRQNIKILNDCNVTTCGIKLEVPEIFQMSSKSLFLPGVHPNQIPDR